LTDRVTSSLSDPIRVARKGLEERLGYHFNDHNLYDEALTHPSVMLSYGPQVNNQRLEFLGDRVIGLLIADALFSATNHEREGYLTRRHADCVSNIRLAQLARNLDIGAVLSVEASFADNDNVLADALEALIGAVWRDGGIDAARRVVTKIWGAMGEDKKNVKDVKDSKTQLQEHAHRLKIPPPEYTIIERDGLDHAPVFTVNVHCAGRDVQATGKSRRMAEQNAAAAWLKDLS
jgi:ribonuclease-3